MACTATRWDFISTRRGWNRFSKKSSPKQFRRRCEPIRVSVYHNHLGQRRRAPKQSEGYFKSWPDRPLTVQSRLYGPPEPGRFLFKRLKWANCDPLLLTLSRLPAEQSND